MTASHLHFPTETCISVDAVRGSQERFPAVDFSFSALGADVAREQIADRGTRRLVVVQHRRDLARDRNVEAFGSPPA